MLRQLAVADCIVSDAQHDRWLAMQDASALRRLGRGPVAFLEAVADGRIPRLPDRELDAVVALVWGEWR